MKDLHGKVRIDSVKVIRPYVIKIIFVGGAEKVIDLGSILYGQMYGPLKDFDLFQKVHVNSEVHTIEWPNGADFDPETLYNWEYYKKDWIETARKWQMEEEV